MKIGKKEIDLTFISAERVIKSADMYNKILTERKEKKLNDYAFTKKLVNVAVYLIHAPVLNIPDIGLKLWIKRNLVSSFILIKTIGYNDLDDFLSIALEPILGSKKKEIEKQDAMLKAGQKAIEAMEPDELRALLRNYVSLTGGKETTA